MSFIELVRNFGASTQKLLALCPHAKLLGLTATNVRYLDNNRDMAEELFDGHVASEMTLGEAIVRGILPALKYVTTVLNISRTWRGISRALTICAARAFRT